MNYGLHLQLTFLITLLKTKDLSLYGIPDKYCLNEINPFFYIERITLIRLTVEIRLVVFAH